MISIYKIVFDLLIAIATSKQAKELYKHVLNKIAQKTDWEWDDELIEELFPEESSNGK